MSSSSTIPSLISSIYILFAVSSLFVTVTTANSPATADSPASDSLIEKACSEPLFSISSQLCIQVLVTQPRIVSATNLLDLSIAIIQSEISNATATRTHVESLIKESTNASLQECKISFDSVIASFNSALNEIPRGAERIATYDLLVGSTDAIKCCENNVASGRINDPVISNGIHTVPIYGMSAYQALSLTLRGY